MNTIQTKGQTHWLAHSKLSCVAAAALAFSAFQSVAQQVPSQPVKNTARDAAHASAKFVFPANFQTQEIQTDGATIAYAYAARYPDKTDRLVVMDAPVPGIPPWDEIVRMPALWHFSFGGPDAERLVAGHERIYLDRFWNEFAGDPSKIDEASRVHYTALYALPGAMRSAFAQFLSIPKDVEDNKVSMTTKLTMPVLALGAAKAFGANVGIIMRNAADNVTEVLIENSGHWLMDEQPTATITAVHDFLDRKTTTTKSLPGKQTAVASLAPTKQFLLTRRSPAYWRVTFNHPPLNIFGPETIPQLNEIITALETDQDVKVVVFDSAVQGF